MSVNNHLAAHVLQLPKFVKQISFQFCLMVAGGSSALLNLFFFFFLLYQLRSVEKYEENQSCHLKRREGLQFQLFSFYEGEWQFNVVEIPSYDSN